MEESVWRKLTELDEAEAGRDGRTGLLSSVNVEYGDELVEWPQAYLEVPVEQLIAAIDRLVGVITVNGGRLTEEAVATARDMLPPVWKESPFAEQVAQIARLLRLVRDVNQGDGSHRGKELEAQLTRLSDAVGRVKAKLNRYEKELIRDGSKLQERKLDSGRSESRVDIADGRSGGSSRRASGLEDRIEELRTPGVLAAEVIVAYNRLPPQSRKTWGTRWNELSDDLAYFVLRGEFPGLKGGADLAGDGRAGGLAPVSSSSVGIGNSGMQGSGSGHAAALAELEDKYFPPGRELGARHRADTVVTTYVDGAAYFGAIADVLDTLHGPGDRLYITSWHLHLATRLRSRAENFLEPDLGLRLWQLAEAGVDVRVIVAVPRHSLSPFEKPLWRRTDFWRWPARYELAPFVDDNIASVRTLRGAVRGLSPLANRVLVDWGGGVDTRHEKSTIAYSTTTGQLHAFVGGLDYEPRAFSSERHAGAPEENFWHDVGVQLRGGAAEAVLDNFWTLWDETATLPERKYWLNGARQLFNPAVEPKPQALQPARSPLPANPPVGSHLDTGVRIWRSYGPLRVTPFTDFLRIAWQTLPPTGIFEIQTGLVAAIDAAERYIYIEDQTLNPSRFGATFYMQHRVLFPAIVRAAARGVKVLFVTQGQGAGVSDWDATPNMSPEIHDLILRKLTVAQRQNFALFYLKDTTVHSKLVMVDDEFVSIGSANVWDRSMVGDESELTAAIVHSGGSASLVADLRVQLWREHLRMPGTVVADALLRDLDVSLGYFRRAWGTGTALDIPHNALKEIPGLPGPADQQARESFEQHRAMSATGLDLALLTKPVRFLRRFQSKRPTPLNQEGRQPTSLRTALGSSRPTNPVGPDRPQLTTPELLSDRLSGGGRRPSEAVLSARRVTRDVLTGMPMTWQRRGIGMHRLAAWTSAMESDEQVEDSLEGCLLRVDTALSLLYGGGRLRESVDDSFLTTPGLGELLAKRGGELTLGHRVTHNAVMNALWGRPGASVVVVAEQDGQPRHAFLLVADGRTGEVVLRWVDREPGLFAKNAELVEDRVRQLHAPGTQLFAFNRTGQPITLAQLGVFEQDLADLSDRTMDALLLAPTSTRRPRGLGPEGEGGFVADDVPADIEEEYGRVEYKALLAKTNLGLGIELETLGVSLGGDGKYYVDEDEFPRGVENLGRVAKWGTEFVIRPLAFLPGDDGRVPVEEFFPVFIDDLRRAVEVTPVATYEGAEPGIGLGDIFPPERYQLTPLGEQMRFRRPEGALKLNWQWTLPIPVVGGMRSVISWLIEGNRTGDTRLRDLLKESSTVGADVASLYLKSIGLDVESSEVVLFSDVAVVDALWGVSALAYLQATASLEMMTTLAQDSSASMLIKNYLGVALRTDWPAVRRGLPEAARQFLGSNNEKIIWLLYNTYRSGNEVFDWAWRAAESDPDAGVFEIFRLSEDVVAELTEEMDPDWTFGDWVSHDVEDYLDNLLLEKPEKRIRHSAVTGMKDLEEYRELETNGGKLQPSLLGELRCFREPRVGPERAFLNARELASKFREVHREAARTRQLAEQDGSAQNAVRKIMRDPLVQGVRSALDSAVAIIDVPDRATILQHLGRIPRATGPDDPIVGQSLAALQSSMQTLRMQLHAAASQPGHVPDPEAAEAMRKLDSVLLQIEVAATTRHLTAQQRDVFSEYAASAAVLAAIGHYHGEDPLNVSVEPAADAAGLSRSAEGRTTQAARESYEQHRAMRLTRTALRPLLETHLTTLVDAGLAHPDTAVWLAAPSSAVLVRSREGAVGSPPATVATPAGTPSDRVLKMLGSALPLAGGVKPGAAIAQLAQWLSEPPPAQPDESAPHAADNVLALYAAFVALHGRAGNAAAPTGFLNNPDPGGLAQLLGGEFGPVGDARLVFGAVRRTPGAMALVRVPGTDRVFGLLADDRTGVVVPRWVDPLVPGSFEHPAKAPNDAFPDTLDDWSRLLAKPGAQVLVLGPDGRPTDLSALLGVPVSHEREPGASRTWHALVETSPLKPAGRIPWPSSLSRLRPRPAGEAPPVVDQNIPFSGRPHLTPMPPPLYKPPAASTPAETSAEAAATGSSAEPDPVWSAVVQADDGEAAKVRENLIAIPELINTLHEPAYPEGWLSGQIPTVLGKLRDRGFVVGDDDRLVRELTAAPESFLHTSRPFDLKTSRGGSETVWISLTPKPSATDEVRFDTNQWFLRMPRDVRSTSHGKGHDQRGWLLVPVPLQIAGAPVTVIGGLADRRPTYGQFSGMSVTDYPGKFGLGGMYLVHTEVDVALQYGAPDGGNPDRPNDSDGAGQVNRDVVSVGRHWFRVNKQIVLMKPTPGGQRRRLTDAGRDLLRDKMDLVQVTGALTPVLEELASRVPVAPPGSLDRHNLRSEWSGNALRQVFRNDGGTLGLAGRQWFGPAAAAGLKVKPKLTDIELVGEPEGDAFLRLQTLVEAAAGSSTESRSGWRGIVGAGGPVPGVTITGRVDYRRTTTKGFETLLNLGRRSGDQYAGPTVLARARYEVTVRSATWETRFRKWARKAGFLSVRTDLTKQSDTVTVEALVEVPEGIYRAATEEIAGSYANAATVVSEPAGPQKGGAKPEKGAASPGLRLPRWLDDLLWLIHPHPQLRNQPAADPSKRRPAASTHAVSDFNSYARQHLYEEADSLVRKADYAGLQALAGELRSAGASELYADLGRRMHDASAAQPGESARAHQPTEDRRALLARSWPAWTEAPLDDVSPADDRSSADEASSVGATVKPTASARVDPMTATTPPVDLLVEPAAGPVEGAASPENVSPIPGEELVRRLEGIADRQEKRHLPLYLYQGQQLRIGPTNFYGAEQMATSVVNELRKVLADHPTYREFVVDWDSPKTKQAVIDQVLQAIRNEQALDVEVGPARLSTDFSSLTSGEIVFRLELRGSPARGPVSRFLTSGYDRFLTITVKARRLRSDDQPPEYLGTPAAVRASSSLSSSPDRKPPGYNKRQKIWADTGKFARKASNRRIGVEGRFRFVRVFNVRFGGGFSWGRQSKVGNTDSRIAMDGGNPHSTFWADPLEVTMEVHALKQRTTRTARLRDRLRGKVPESRQIGGPRTWKQYVAFTVPKDLTLSDDKQNQVGSIRLGDLTISDPANTDLLEFVAPPAHPAGADTRKAVNTWDYVYAVDGAEKLKEAIVAAVTDARQQMIDDGAVGRGTAVGVAAPGSDAHLLLNQQINPDTLAGLLMITSDQQPVRLHGLGEVLGDPVLGQGVQADVWLRAKVDNWRPGPQGVLAHTTEHAFGALVSSAGSWTRGWDVWASAGPGVDVGRGPGGFALALLKRLGFQRIWGKERTLLGYVERSDFVDGPFASQVVVAADAAFDVHVVLRRSKVLGSPRLYQATREVTGATSIGMMNAETAREVFLASKMPATDSEPALRVEQAFNTTLSEPLTVPDRTPTQAGAGQVSPPGDGPAEEITLPRPPKNLGVAVPLDVPPLMHRQVIDWLKTVQLPLDEDGTPYRPLISTGEDFTDTDASNVTKVVEFASTANVLGNWGALIDGGISPPSPLTYETDGGFLTSRTDKVQLFLQIVAEDETGQPTAPERRRVFASPKDFDQIPMGQVGTNELRVDTTTDQWWTELQPYGSNDTGMGLGDLLTTRGEARSTLSATVEAIRDLGLSEVSGPWAEVRQRVKYVFRAFHQDRQLGEPLVIPHEHRFEKFANHLRSEEFAADPLPPAPTMTSVRRVPNDSTIEQWQAGHRLAAGQEKRGEPASSPLKLPPLPPRSNPIDFRGAAAVQAAAVQALKDAGVDVKRGSSMASALHNRLSHTNLWGLLRPSLGKARLRPDAFSNKLEFSFGDGVHLELWARVPKTRLSDVYPWSHRDDRRSRAAASVGASEVQRLDSALAVGVGASTSDAGGGAPETDAPPAPQQVVHLGLDDHRDPTSFQGGAGAGALAGGAGGRAGGTAVQGATEESLLDFDNPDAEALWDLEFVVVAKNSGVFGSSAAVQLTIPGAVPVLIGLLDAAQHVGFADNPAAMLQLSRANVAATALRKASDAWRDVNRTLENERLEAELANLRNPTDSSANHVLMAWPSPDDPNPSPTAAAWIQAQQDWYAKKRALDEEVSSLKVLIAGPKVEDARDVLRRAIHRSWADREPGLRRLEAWAANEDRRAEWNPPHPRSCVYRTLGGILSFYGRLGWSRRADLERLIDSDLADVEALVGRTSTSARDVDFAGLLREVQPDQSVVVTTSRPGRLYRHQYLLVATESGLRVVDEPGSEFHGVTLPRDAAQLTNADERTRRLYDEVTSPDTKLLLLGKNGPKEPPYRSGGAADSPDGGTDSGSQGSGSTEGFPPGSVSGSQSPAAESPSDVAPGLAEGDRGGESSGPSAGHVLAREEDVEQGPTVPDPGPVADTSPAGPSEAADPQLASEELRRIMAARETEEQVRQRLSGWLDGMRQQNVLSLLPPTVAEADGDGSGPREAIEELLTVWARRVPLARGEELADLHEAVRDTARALHEWRQEVVRHGRQQAPHGITFPDELDVPLFEELAERAYELQSRLNRLEASPAGRQGSKTPGMWTPPTARMALQGSVGWFAAERMRLQRALADADRESGKGKGKAVGPDGVDAAALVGKARSDVDKAAKRLEALIAAIEGQIKTDVDVWTVAPQPEGWTPSKPYRPGLTLAPRAGVRPALGTASVREVSEGLRNAMVEAAWQRLPERLQTPETRQRLQDAVSEDALIRDDTEFTSDGVLVMIDGYAVRMGAVLDAAEQASDPFQRRVKSVTNKRERMGREFGHMMFADINGSATWVFDHLYSTAALKMIQDATYLQVFSFLLTEDEESRNHVFGTATEHNSVGRSYQSILWSYAARPFAEVMAPDGTRQATDDADAPEPVPDAMTVLTSRETSVPDPERPDSDNTTVYADSETTYVALASGPIRPPFNSVVEAVPGAGYIRRWAEDFVGDRARPGTFSYNMLANGLRTSALKAGVREGTDGHGYSITYGEVAGKPADSVKIHFKLSDPQPSVVKDPYSAIDTSGTNERGVNIEKTTTDSIDVFGPSFTAFNAIFKHAKEILAYLSHLEPYFMWWPFIEAGVTSNSSDINVKETVGLRTYDTETSVVAHELHVRFEHSDQPGKFSEWQSVPGGVSLRMLRNDAAKVVSLPAESAGDDVASVDPELQLPADLPLPSPFVQLAGVRLDGHDGGPDQQNRDLVAVTLDLLREHQSSVLTAENVATVTKLLREDNLPIIAPLAAAADGFPFRLMAKDVKDPSGHLDDEVVVRVHMVEQPGAKFDYREPGGELDTFRTSTTDLSHELSRNAQLWYGLEPVISLQSERFPKQLKAIEARPIVRGRVGRTEKQISGFETEVVQGTAIDDLTQFIRRAEYRVSIERRSLRAQVMPGAFPVEADPELGAPPADPQAAPPALPRVVSADPISATHTVMVPTEFTEQVVPDPGDGSARRVPFSVARLIEAGLLPRGATHLGGPDGKPLEFVPTEEKKLPRNTMLAVGTSGVTRAAVEMLAQGGRRLSAKERVELENLVAAAGTQANRYLGDRPRQVWSGAAGWGGKAKVRMRFVPEKLRTIGAPEGFGPFSGAAVTSLAGLGSEKVRGGVFALRLRAPADPEAPQAGAQPSGKHTFTYQPQGGHRREVRTADGTILSGTTSDDFLDIGRSVVAVVEKGRWEVHVEFMGRDAAAEPRTVPTKGLASLSGLDASNLGLMPRGLEITLDTAVAYELPDFVRRSQGIGGPVTEPPDISNLVDEVVRSVRGRLGEDAAEAVEEQLEKLNDPLTAGAMLEQFFGTARQTVAAMSHPRIPRTSVKIPITIAERTIAVEITAKIADERNSADMFKGVARGWKRLSHTDADGREKQAQEGRLRRWQFDWGRLWLVTLPENVNSFWFQNNISNYRQKTRRRAVKGSAENATVTVVDNRDQRGIAYFELPLLLSAKITADTAPPLTVDAVTLGSLQSGDEWDVAEDEQGRPFSATATVAYDPNLLRARRVPTPPDLLGAGSLADNPAEEPEASVGRPRAQAPDTAVPFVPGRPEIKTLTADGSLAQYVRLGYRISPALLQEARVEPIADLEEIRQQAFRLAVPEQLPYWTGLVDHVVALWNNYVSNPPPGASFYRSRLFKRDFISAIINKAFLGKRVPDVLTAGIAAPIQNHGRTPVSTDSDLELFADVIHMRAAGEVTDDVMSKLGSSNADTLDVSIGNATGLWWNPWINADWPKSGPVAKNPDRSNALGILPGGDLIRQNEETAKDSARISSSQVEKTSRRTYTRMVFTVQWSIADTPRKRENSRPPLWQHLASRLGAYLPNVGAYLPNVGAYLPNVGAYLPNVGAYLPGRQRQYVTELETHEIGLWVPTENVEKLLASPFGAVGPASTPAGVVAAAGEVWIGAVGPASTPAGAVAAAGEVRRLAHQILDEPSRTMPGTKHPAVARRRARVERFLSEVEPRLVRAPAELCVPLVSAVYGLLTDDGRFTNRPVDASHVATTDLSRVLAALNGELTAVRDVDLGALRTRLQASPGAMVLVSEVPRQRGGRELPGLRHAYWLWVDDEGVVRRLDPQRPGSFENDANEDWVRQLAHPGTRIALFDPAERKSSSLDDVLRSTPVDTVEALVDPDNVLGKHGATRARDYGPGYWSDGRRQNDPSNYRDHLKEVLYEQDGQLAHPEAWVRWINTGGVTDSKWTAFAVAYTLLDGPTVAIKGHKAKVGKKYQFAYNAQRTLVDGFQEGNTHVPRATFASVAGEDGVALQGADALQAIAGRLARGGHGSQAVVRGTLQTVGGQGVEVDHMWNMVNFNGEVLSVDGLRNNVSDSSLYANAVGPVEAIFLDPLGFEPNALVGTKAEQYRERLKTDMLAPPARWIRWINTGGVRDPLQAAYAVAYTFLRGPAVAIKGRETKVGSKYTLAYNAQRTLVRGWPDEDGDLLPPASFALEEGEGGGALQAIAAQLTRNGDGSQAVVRGKLEHKVGDQKVGADYVWNMVNFDGQILSIDGVSGTVGDSSLYADRVGPVWSILLDSLGYEYGQSDDPSPTSSVFTARQPSAPPTPREMSYPGGPVPTDIEGVGRTLENLAGLGPVPEIIVTGDSDSPSGTADQATSRRSGSRARRSRPSGSGSPSQDGRLRPPGSVAGGAVVAGPSRVRRDPLPQVPQAYLALPLDELTVLINELGRPDADGPVAARSRLAVDVPERDAATAVSGLLELVEKWARLTSSIGWGSCMSWRTWSPWSCRRVKLAAISCHPRMWVPPRDWSLQYGQTSLSCGVRAGYWRGSLRRSTNWRWALKLNQCPGWQPILPLRSWEGSQGSRAVRAARRPRMILVLTTDLARPAGWRAIKSCGSWWMPAINSSIRLMPCHSRLGGRSSLRKVGRASFNNWNFFGVSLVEMIRPGGMALTPSGRVCKCSPCN
ncbi:hypothetical protein A6A27_38630 [Micromonospora sp. CB01531]|nr:hypothetical protein A6A27_38630 [Micromonospora sp. CB01531]